MPDRPPARASAPPTLVFLYGPPAVGKLTVARALAKRLPFRVLHNHATIDPILPFFDYGSRGFWDVVGRLRRDIVDVAAREGIDLVYTFVFASGEEDHVERIVQPYEAVGGRVCLVQLLAPVEILRERVTLPSRREFQKLGDPYGVDRILERYDLVTPVSGRAGLTFDTSQLSAEAIADAIVAHLSSLP